MAFKRSGVRLPLSPPKEKALKSIDFGAFLLFFLPLRIAQVNKMVNNCRIMLERRLNMASIYPNMKDGKIVSFKFKVFLGRDENGKQVFRCMTWTPSKAMAETRLKQQAEKEAAIWERQVAEQFASEKTRFTPAEITFEEFVQTIWMPAKMNEKDHRASTIAFHTYILRIILDYLGQTQLQAVTNTCIEEYLDYLQNTYKTKQNRPLAPKTIRHHCCTLNLILSYAKKIGYIADNPMEKVDIPKLVRHKVDALSRGEVLEFIRETEKLPPYAPSNLYAIVDDGYSARRMFRASMGGRGL